MRIRKYIFLLFILFIFISNVKADLQDFSGGGSGSVGSTSGAGTWHSDYVGIKVSIVNGSNEVDDVEIFLNSKGKGSSSQFSYNNNPKTHQSTPITWTEKRTTYEASFLPGNWKNGEDSIDLYKILTKDDYKNLKNILNRKEVDAGSGDYIIIEPMVKIGSYYGTAFELGNAFSLNSLCKSSSSFCYKYAKAVFSGNSNNTEGGVLYTTLYLANDISALGLTEFSSKSYSERRTCFTTSTCGRGLGVFKYDDIMPPEKKLTIVYHSNGATAKKFKKEAFTDDSDIDATVISKGTAHTSGLANIQNEDWLYLSRTGYTPTGNWLLGSATSTTKLNQNTAITWNGSKAMIGSIEIADLSSGSKTIDVYAEWEPNILNVYYNANGGIINSSDTYKLVSNYVYTKSKNHKFYQTWTYDNTKTHGLYNYTSFGITRSSYKFTGWGTSPTGGTIFDQDDATLKPSDLNPNIENGDQTLTLYAQWAPTLTIKYHNNGATTKKYNGVDFINDSSIPDTVLNLGQTYTTGLFDVQHPSYTTNPTNPSYLYLAKTNYVPTKNWLLDSATSTTKLDQYIPITWNGSKAMIGSIEIADLSSGSKTIHVYAEWLDACIDEFRKTNGGNPSKIQRIYLYKKYAPSLTNSSVNNRKNLLNFGISDATTACGNYTPDYGATNSCLSVNQVNQATKNKFTSGNLSDYNDKISNGNNSSYSDIMNNGFDSNDYYPETGYCLTDFSLNKAAGAIYTEDVVKAGRMFLTGDNDGVVVEGNLIKTCYIHEDEYERFSGVLSGSILDPNEYVPNVKLMSEELIKDISLDDTEIVREDNFFKVVRSATIKYKIKPVYVEKITGKQKNESDCFESSVLKKSCRILGNGLASKFIDGNCGNNECSHSFEFSVEYPENSVFDSGSAISPSCSYKVKSEVIKYSSSSSNDSGKLELEFRVIDTNKPFNNRGANSNWQGNMKINTPTGEIEILKEDYIKTYGNNSYNKTGVGSLYTNQTDGIKRIILTPNIIKDIREYNANNPYNNYIYEFDTNTSIWKNKFLTEKNIIR